MLIDLDRTLLHSKYLLLWLPLLGGRLLLNRLGLGQRSFDRRAFDCSPLDRRTANDRALFDAPLGRSVACPAPDARLWWSLNLDAWRDPLFADDPRFWRHARLRHQPGLGNNASFGTTFELRRNLDLWRQPDLGTIRRLGTTFSFGVTLTLGTILVLGRILSLGVSLTLGTILPLGTIRSFGAIFALGNCFSAGPHLGLWYQPELRRDLGLRLQFAQEPGFDLELAFDLDHSGLAASASPQKPRRAQTNATWQLAATASAYEAERALVATNCNNCFAATVPADLAKQAGARIEHEDATAIAAPVIWRADFGRYDRDAGAAPFAIAEWAMADLDDGHADAGTTREECRAGTPDRDAFLPPPTPGFATTTNTASARFFHANRANPATSHTCVDDGIKDFSARADNSCVH